MASRPDLIDLVYAAMLGEVTWPDVMDALACRVPDGRATLFLHDPLAGVGRFSLTAGFSAAEVAAYNDTWAAHNPWMKSADRRPIGQGVVADQMLAPSELARTAFHDGFLVPMRVRSAVGVTIEREKGRMFLLSVLSARGGISANLSHARLLTVLAPHLRRAMRLRRRAPAVEESTAAAIEGLGAGVIVLGEGRRIRMASPLAREVLSEDRGLGADAAGRLRVRDPDLADRLACLLRWSEPQPPEIRTVLAWRGHSTRLFARKLRSDCLSDMLQGPTVLLLLLPLTGSQQSLQAVTERLDCISSTFGLSLAEKEVLRSLAGGLSPRRIAHQRNVTDETVRNQIRSLRQKTGQHRQADLVRLMLTWRDHPPTGG